MNVVFASQNPGKILELQHLLFAFNLKIIPQDELSVTDVEETASTFVENALIKARNACLHSNLPAIADDSGLVVPALHGAPGIYSARYAGKQGDAKANIEKLLVDMKDIPEEQRQAHFHCSLVYLAHAEDPAPIICEGIWQGTILQTPSGNKGFGYDPIFYIPEQQCTAAEMTMDQKNILSHRGQALRELVNKLAERN
jgi:XTP/dITP diphosphohydrolase